MKLFIGTGLLGSAFIKAMLERGESLRVWNRTYAKAKGLEEFGAQVFEQLSEAVEGVDIIHLCLKDDEAVASVLASVEDKIQAGAFILDHSTTSVEGAKKRTDYWLARSVSYLHCPVMMGPVNALRGTGVMFVSGNQQWLEQMNDSLSSMTGTVLNLGAEVGKAAGIKLIGNLFLMSVNAGLSDIMTMFKSLGYSLNDLHTLFGVWDPGKVVNGAYKKLKLGKFDQATWELKMARKDAGLMMSETEKGGNQLRFIPQIAALMDQFIEAGQGQADWTIWLKDSRPEH